VSALEVWIEQTHRDWLDVDGRPLGEIASRLYPSDTIEVVCPYSGARRGKPMNESARRQVVAHRDAGLATLAGALSDTATGADLLRVCTAMIVAPLHHERPTPAAVASAYKTNLGFQQTLLSLCLDTPEVATTPVRDLPDAATLLAALEAGNWLVGQRQACAGSPGDIALAWEIMCRRRAPPDVPGFRITDGRAALTVTALVVALVLATQERLNAGDREGLVGYGTDHADRDRWPLGARLWKARPAPWLVAATARPDRPATSVRRLFRDVPPEIDRFLAAISRAGSHLELEQAFRRATTGFDPTR
jgi:hypothetical protein